MDRKKSDDSNLNPRRKKPAARDQSPASGTAGIVYPSDNASIDDLIEAFGAQVRAGLNPSIEEYENRFPDHADDIRSLFPSVQWMEQLKDEENEQRVALENDSFAGPLLSAEFEDYQIIREIGRGGMGVVFEAFQKTLQRRVALKLLHENSVSSAKRVARFAREARSAAGLHHSNIVPVFGFGHFDQTYYYAMQFINGVTIEQVVEALRQTIADDSNSENAETAAGLPNADRHFSASSAISHARALRQGEYNKPRRIESESQISGSSISEETGIENFSSQKSVAPDNPTRADISESSSPTQLPDETGADKRIKSVTDTFDLFQLTSGDADGDSVPPPTITASSGRVRNQDLKLEKLSRPYWKSISRVGFQIADALNYAHGNKIIHRDIKPANLLLDAKGTVWVTDFGLAKVVEQEDLTKTGDTVGTLRYMAPEQVDGRVDNRSDIYSLGLTLYELATLRPAFDQSTHAKLFKDKTDGLIESPRKISPNIPRDLETIILKATAVNPANRYQSAGQMASDLQRFLEDRPIHSRRATATERFVRWSTRNPAIAFLLGLAAALLLITAVTATVGYMNTTSALARAETNRKQAEDNFKFARDAYQQSTQNLILAKESKKQSDATLNVAMDAFDSIIENLSSRGIPDSIDMEFDDEDAPRFQTTLTTKDAELLNSLLGFYEKLAQQNATDRQIRLKKANAHQHMGAIHTRLADWQKAGNAFRESIKIYDELLQEPDVETNSSELLVISKARALNELGIMLNASSSLGEAFMAHRSAKTYLTAESKTHPESRDIQFELGKTLELLGSLIIRSGMLEIGIENGKQQELDERLNQELQNRGDSVGKIRPPRDPDPLRRWQRNRQWRPENPSDFARRDLNRAAEIFAKLVQVEPKNPEYRLALARTQRNQLIYALKLDQTDSADRYYNAAIENLEILATDFPTNPAYQYELADTLSLASTQLNSITTADQARDKITRAMNYCFKLATTFPNVAEYKLLSANCHRKLALVETADGQRSAALKEFDTAIKEFAEIIKQNPTAGSYQISLAMTYKELADAYREFGVENNNAEDLRRSKEILTSSIKQLNEFRRESQNQFYTRIQASLFFSLAATYLELGDVENAFRAEHRSRELSDRPWRSRMLNYSRGRRRSQPPNRASDREPKRVPE